MSGKNMQDKGYNLEKGSKFVLLYRNYIEKGHANGDQKEKISIMDTLDKIDLLILQSLQENARLTTKELAARVHLTTTPVFERVKRLETGGYIRRYTAVLDAEKLNQGFMVYCNVKMNRMSHEIATDFMNRIGEIPEVTECYNVSGHFDYLLKILAPNMKYYQEFILNVLGSIENLGSLESTFVMDVVKQNYAIPIYI